VRVKQQIQNRTKDRALVAAYVNLDERDLLFRLAREEDRSVSAVVRRALRAELARSQEQR
jgi:post-segregation antitoxin (ccd killing protein)